MSAEQATLHNYSKTIEEHLRLTIDVKQEAGGDMGISNIYKMIEPWGEDYADILNSDELCGEGTREYPYAVQRGGQDV